VLGILWYSDEYHWDTTRSSATRIFLCCLLMASTHIQLCAIRTTLRHSIACIRGYGILTVCPSGAAFAIPLGPTNPSSITVAKETSVFQRAGVSPALWLLVPAFSPRNAPVWVTPLPSVRLRALSYQRIRTDPYPFLSFGTVLSPDYLRRKDSR
jgi:hypothetical protein